MKILKIFLIVSVIASIMGCSSEKRENDLTEYNLKGKVKSIRVKAFNADEKFGEIIKSEWKKLSLIQDYRYRDEFVSFNENGFKIEEIKFYSGNILLDRKDYIYGEHGIKMIARQDSIGDQYIDERYHYDEKGQLDEKQDYKINGDVFIKTNYKYNELGQIIEEIRTYSDNSGSARKKEYDDSNNLIRESIYDRNTGELKERKTLEYKNGLLQYKTEYTAEGSIHSTDEIIYSDDGKIKEEITVFYPHETPYYEYSKQIQHRFYNNKGILIKFTRKILNVPDLLHIDEYKYEYDNKGNWIRKLFYHNGIIVHVYEREIEYYKTSWFANDKEEISRIGNNQTYSAEKSDIKSDWNKFEIVGVCKISIPPTMELRENNSFIRFVADKLSKSLRKSKN